MITNITLEYIEIDVDDVFNTLCSEEKRQFINKFIAYASTKELFREFVNRCNMDKVSDGSIAGTEVMRQKNFQDI